MPFGDAADPGALPRVVPRGKPVARGGGEGRCPAPPRDIQLLAQERCEDPQMYRLWLGYFGKGRSRSCDRSWGLQVWRAGSCLSDSHPLPDLGETREPPRCWGQLSHPLVMMKTKCWAVMWLGTTRENGDQSSGVGANPTPALWDPYGQATCGPQGCPGGAPHFFTAVPPPAPALWLGQDQPRPPRSPGSPGWVPGADGGEGFLQARSPSGSGA